MFKNQYLRKILNRRRYTGSYTYGDLELHDENQRIISDELFDRVQIQLQAKRRTGRIAREQYILVGKLFCGYCRNPIRGESGRNHRIEYIRIINVPSIKQVVNALKQPFREILLKIILLNLF